MPYIERDFPVEQVNELAVREVNARKPIYQVHKWWARRPGPTFRAIILASFLDEDPMDLYYQHVDLKEKLGYAPIILDPFMGGGTTIVEGVRLGAKMIGIDINPVAWFITKKEIEPVDPDAFRKEFERIKKAVADKIKQYYKTRCPLGHVADVMYVFWVRVIRCENCWTEVPLFDDFRIATRKDSVYYLCPQCRAVVKLLKEQNQVLCPSCDSRFNPKTGYVDGAKYKCPACLYTGEITKAVRKAGDPPKLEMFAVEFYCSKCGTRDYKKIDEIDVEKFQEASRVFDNRREQIEGRLIPDQEIPDGFNTKQVKNFLYARWCELFTKRQLLCLSLLLEEILKIKDKSVREFFIITFSDSVNGNNMMCKYYSQYRTEGGSAMIVPLFGHHVLWPPQRPVENNVWGIDRGASTFINYVDKALRALRYCNKPYEVKINKNGGKEKIFIQGEKVSAKVCATFGELTADKEVLLRVLTAEDLRSVVPSESVDAVITDPPYYDNIMYSELSDFFYVWLRLGLKDAYSSEFGSPLVDQRREIVVNSSVGKDPEFYTEAMKRCFAEIFRVLKKQGLLVMTFHHSSPEAWSAILKSLVDSGFTIGFTYPIHSETRSGVHPGIEYDSILVCRKVRPENLPAKAIPSTLLEAEIRNRVESDADRFVANHPKLTIEDLYVMVMGRALQVLSENYAVLKLKAGRSPSKDEIERALEGLGEIAFDILLRKFFARIPDVDRLSKIYASVFAGREYIDMDTIDKVTKHGMLDMKVFESELLVGEKKKSMRKVVQPEERRSHIEGKLKRGHSLLYIDAAQMLLLAWNEGRFNRAIGDYVRNGIEKEKLMGYIKFLYERTGIREWGQILKEVEQAPVSSLEKWL